MERRQFWGREELKVHLHDDNSKIYMSHSARAAEYADWQKGKTLPMSVLDMTLNNLVRFKYF